MLNNVYFQYFQQQINEIKWNGYGFKLDIGRAHVLLGPTIATPVVICITL